MSRRYRHVLGFVLAITLVSHACHAQYAWQVIVDRSDDSTDSYSPVALAGSGNHCTVIINAGRRSGNWYEFLRSDDGGQTLHEQFRFEDYGLPYPSFSYVNALQQIDSANAVVIGDSGRILRTSDAGVTWERQDFPSPYSAPTLRSVHFHDALNGIVTLADRPITTSDGGKNWELGPYLGVGASSCHCYGSGRYAVLRETDGRLYRTSDNWQTIDSIMPVIDTAAHSPDLRWARWTEGDTILACGQDQNGGLILLSTNAGASWNKAQAPRGATVMSMTELTDDTLVAGRANFAFNSVLVSTNRGMHWDSDTVPVEHAGALFPTSVFCSIVRTRPGVVLAATQQVQRGVGQIIRGTITSAAVAPNRWIATSSASPDPSWDNVTLWFSTKPEPVYILDILGRTVLRLDSPGGPVTLDVSRLPSGTYFAAKGIERIRFVKR